MNAKLKKILVIIGVMLLVLLTATLLLQRLTPNKTKDGIGNRSKPPITGNGSGNVSITFTGQSAQVHNYDKQIYENAINLDKLLVLYFYANWCPICRKEFPQMQDAFKQLPGDKVIGIRINFNDSDTDTDEQALAKEYDVSYQHTKVIIKNNEVVLKTLESWSKSDYINEISDYLSSQN